MPNILYNWFINISKRINERHQIGFTGFGAPQWHDQRNYNNGLTIDGWQEVRDYMQGESPYRYNPTFGFRSNGKAYNSNHNFYHKPQLAINHIWQIDDRSSLSTSVYASITSGGGRDGTGRTAYDAEDATAAVLSTWQRKNNDRTTYSQPNQKNYDQYKNSGRHQRPD